MTSTRPTAAPPRRWSWWRRSAFIVLVVATTVLGLTTIVVGATVADGDPDDITPTVDSLAFLRSRLDAGSAEEAQELFPEGYFFSFALYGLAWTDLAAAGHVEAGDAHREARYALDHLSSPAGTEPFTETLSPRFGIFHAGWTLLLQAQTASLDPDLPADERGEVATAADEVATAFEQALDEGRSPFLAAYPRQSWPVDNVVAMAGLRQADRVTGADHGPLIDAWLAAASTHHDPQTGLLPHQSDVDTGAGLGGARGTSQSIIQRLWPIVDPATAPETYARFREHFVASSAGFVGVREHPHGVDGPGDVDSGPLVLGFSASASAVAIGSARANGDADLAVTILHEADVFGAPLTLGGSRRYALGLLPIGDAFVTWSRAAPLGAPVEHPAVVATWPAYLLVPWAVLAAGWLGFARSRHRRHRP